MVYFRLYESDGVTLKYTLPVVFQANYPHTEKDLIEHKNIRGNGSIIVDGGEAPWDLTLRGVLRGSSYDTLMDLVDDMEEAIVLNDPLVLKIVSTGEATTYTYNVKRIVPIEYDNSSLRTDIMEYTVIFRVASWS